MNNLKKYLPDVIVLAVFVIISFFYFFPADTENRVLYQHDASAGRGGSQELTQFKEQTGELSRWTNTVFSGMPTYQTAPSYSSSEGLKGVMTAYHLGLPEYVWYVFVYLLGFYIMLRAFNYRQSLAALGAVIWAFSSYFFIIIAAGHIWKVFALAYLPPLIGGVALTFRGKLLPGFLLTTLFSAFEVAANHVQMTYYYLFIILFMMVAFLIEAIREGHLARFFKAFALCVIAALIGVAINSSNLYHTWQYQKETMRGKSELVKAGGNDAANMTSSGLKRDYITQWSYGISETWTLLVPNTKGGASMPLSQNETAMKKANPEFTQLYQQLTQYWGTQPMTSGPVYVGAFVLMLFVLSWFVVKGPMKWALLGVTILSILLSWGKNFMWLTDLFIDYVPMYAKFRAVASILVIAEFTIPLLAVMALKRIIDDPQWMRSHMRYFWISLGLTAGVALLFAIAPTLFFNEWVPSQEQMMLQQGLPGEYVAPIMANLTEMRIAMFTADSWRSVLIIAIGAALLWWMIKKTDSQQATPITKQTTPIIIAMAVLCLIDMWTVNKRYLNDDMFVSRSLREMPIEPSQANLDILKDTDPNYRVMNLTDPNGPFNENNTSFFHKSIGGYHPAKLRRYQEMIETYIAPELQQLQRAQIASADSVHFTISDGDSIYPVLNMLNARWFILPLGNNGAPAAVRNTNAFGNAWFVDNIHYAQNANEEIDVMAKLDLRHEAVADKQFETALGKATDIDSTARITMKECLPNKLTYEVESSKEGVIVFSEVYYPEWKATIDGNEAQLARTNYILRALRMPAGKHTVVLDFHPKSIATTETVAYIATVIFLLILIAAAVMTWRKRHSTTTDTTEENQS